MCLKPDSVRLCAEASLDDARLYLRDILLTGVKQPLDALAVL
jgi:hypothetical protein